MILHKNSCQWNISYVINKKKHIVQFNNVLITIILHYVILFPYPSELVGSSILPLS